MALGGLGALGTLGAIGGGVGTGLDQATRARLQQIQAQLMQQQAQQSGQQDTALGRGLMQGAGMPLPQQSPMPNASPIQALLAKFGGGGTPPSQPAPTMPGAAAPPAAPAPSPPQAGQTPPAAPAGGAPQQAAGPSPEAASAIKQLDFPTLVNMVTKANPGIDPKTLGGLMLKLTPFMNAQANAQYRQMMTQLMPTKVAIEQQRADTGAAGVQEKTQHDRALEDQFQQREGRLTSQFSEHLTLAKQKLKDAEGATDVRFRQSAVTDAEREVNRAQNLIQNEMTYGGNDPNRDARTKEFQTQLDAAKAAVDAAKAQPGPPANYEGKDQGRAPPETVQGTRLTTSQQPADGADVMAKAKDAIAKGAPRDAVMKRLQDAGYPTTGL